MGTGGRCAKYVTAGLTGLCCSGVNAQEKVATLEALLARVKKNAVASRGRSMEGAPVGGVAMTGALAPPPPERAAPVVKPAVVEAKPVTPAGKPVVPAAKPQAPAKEAADADRMVALAPPLGGRSAAGRPAEPAKPLEPAKPAVPAAKPQAPARTPAPPAKPPVEAAPVAAKPAEKPPIPAPKPADRPAARPARGAPPERSPAPKPVEETAKVAAHVEERITPVALIHENDTVPMEHEPEVRELLKPPPRGSAGSLPQLASMDDEESGTEETKLMKGPIPVEARQPPPELPLPNLAPAPEPPEATLPLVHARPEEAFSTPSSRQGPPPPALPAPPALAEVDDPSKLVAAGAAAPVDPFARRAEERPAPPPPPEPREVAPPRRPELGRTAPSPMFTDLSKVEPNPEPKPEPKPEPRVEAQPPPVEEPVQKGGRKFPVLLLVLLVAAIIGAVVFLGLRKGWFAGLLGPQPAPITPVATTPAKGPDLAPTPVAHPTDTAKVEAPASSGSAAAPQGAATPSGAASAAPATSASATPAASSSATPAASAAAGAADGADGSALGDKRGYLLVNATAPAVVYLNGVFAGPTGQKLEVDCGPKYLRLGAPLPEGAPKPASIIWVSEGKSAKIACHSVTTVSLDVRPQ